MTYSPELHKDSIEESAIISAFCQIMDIRFKGTTTYDLWKKMIFPVVREYLHKLIGVDEAVLNSNVEKYKRRVEEQRKEWESRNKKNFNSIQEALQFLKEKGINVNGSQ